MRVNLDGLKALAASGGSPDAVRESKKLQFMVVTKWGAGEDTKTYREEAFNLRRSLDALTWTEEQFSAGRIVMMHKVASSAMTFQLVTAESHEDLNAFLKSSPAHNRYETREVYPMTDWGAGRADFIEMIKRTQNLAEEEDRALQSGTFREF